MSTDSNSQVGSSSIRPSRTGFVASGTGSSRPSRPGQLDPSLAAQLTGGMDPQQVSEMSHVSAASLLDKVHHTEDPEVVERVLTLVDREGVDLIAELWSDTDPDSLPGILWRLYMLRSWMRRDADGISRLWRLGEPTDTAASAIAGVDSAPEADNIARTADSILSGAFTGDFAVALERAGAFCDVIARGIKASVRRSTGTAETKSEQDEAALRTASSLNGTARDFLHGAALWRRGRLE
ncbi:Uncharacterized protein JF68_12930 [Bifidobacterium coryneforme]|uniref:Thymidine phosphorylase n=1 Tax=Bifidobacterium coryneforme TaxID=1687 RepID=A0ABD4AEC1_9BIFI|nr:Uncharacterized protein JF68_12930 [Bifidobacterium coryneforme]